jgi:four helix bundle suffix protein
LADYEDFLRHRDLEIWDKTDPRVVKIRDFSAKYIRNLSILRNLEKAPKLPKNPEIAANTMLTLCHQATYLLNKQVESLEKKHKEEGGYTEKLYNTRLKYLRSHK